MSPTLGKKVTKLSVMVYHQTQNLRVVEEGGVLVMIHVSVKRIRMEKIVLQLVMKFLNMILLCVVGMANVLLMTHVFVRVVITELGAK